MDKVEVIPLAVLKAESYVEIVVHLFSFYY